MESVLNKVREAYLEWSKLPFSEKNKERNWRVGMELLDLIKKMEGRV